ncbi:hypothetical protein [Mesorhizobium sp. Cs1321R2N1]|uniref:hypothetical protein n=1 Tax=Mesorhizobium sp. Cs1321R2N1 TaxID=3015174 RepID=UPI00301C41DA
MPDKSDARTEPPPSGISDYPAWAIYKCVKSTRAMNVVEEMSFGGGTMSRGGFTQAGAGKKAGVGRTKTSTGGGSVRRTDHEKDKTGEFLKRRLFTPATPQKSISQTA